MYEQEDAVIDRLLLAEEHMDRHGLGQLPLSCFSAEEKMTILRLNELHVAEVAPPGLVKLRRPFFFWRMLHFISDRAQDAGAPGEARPGKPLYKHDRKSCVFLGRYFYPKEGRSYDLYVCPGKVDLLFVRYGSGRKDLVMGGGRGLLQTLRYELEHPLAIALIRAAAIGEGPWKDGPPEEI